MWLARKERDISFDFSSKLNNVGWGFDNWVSWRESSLIVLPTSTIIKCRLHFSRFQLDFIAFSGHFRSPVNAVSTIVFNLLVRFNVCHKPVRTYDVGAPSAITISLPGMDPADAERRR